jgi:hypothetical protein
MLTNDAYRERKWGRFPALRVALDGQQRTTPLWISTDDSISDSSSRLIEICELACEHTNEIRTASESVGWPAMHADLKKLAEDLKHLSEFFHRAATQVEDLHRLENL